MRFDLLICSSILFFSSLQRITIQEIKQLPWFFKNLPKELSEIEKTNFKHQEHNQPSQSVDEIMQIVQEARTPGEGAKAGDQAMAGGSGLDDLDADIDSEVDVSGDYVTAVWEWFGFRDLITEAECVWKHMVSKITLYRQKEIFTAQNISIVSK